MAANTPRRHLAPAALDEVSALQAALTACGTFTDGSAPKLRHT